MKNKITAGTRGSMLALKQTEIIINLLKQAHPDLKIDIKIIKTLGDKILDKSLDKIGEKGLFIKEIEDALLDNEIDFAVHSFKDVPNVLPEGLCIGAISKREDPRDVLVGRNNQKLCNLPYGAIIGSSSVRRTLQLKRIRPDLQISPIRGNIDTRIKKLTNGEYDAIILAAAGLNRLGWEDKIIEYLEIKDFIPAAAQGALAVEARKSDKDILEMIKLIHNDKDAGCVLAERVFLNEIGGGCHIPAGAYAYIEDDKIILEGFMVVNSQFARDKVILPQEQHNIAGIELAHKLLKQVKQ